MAIDQEARQKIQKVEEDLFKLQSLVLKLMERLDAVCLKTDHSEEYIS